jgi:hypothetical protein
MTFPFCFCPSRRGQTHNLATTNGGYFYGLIDYAAATPSSSSNDQTAGLEFWRGTAGTGAGSIPPEDFGLIMNRKFLGMAIRTKACSPIGFNDVKDGLSNTLLLSEKFLPLDSYDGSGPMYQGQIQKFGGDDRGWSDGWDYDIIRSTGTPPRRDAYVDASQYLQLDTERITFGSAHSSGINAVFGDNSVHTISYEIDREVFNKLGNRVDGQVVDASQWVN